MLYWMAFQSLHAELSARMTWASDRRRFAPSRHWLRLRASLAGNQQGMC
jgi:hypothetical protein